MIEKSFQNFAHNFKYLRKKKGYSQTKLAELLGITKQTIINYEKGETFPPSTRLPQIMEVLDVSAEQLLGTENLFVSNSQLLLDLYQEKAMLISKIQLFSDIVVNKDEDGENLRDFLLGFLKLDERSNSEIVQLLIGFHDFKIKELSRKLDEDMKQFSMDMALQELQVSDIQHYNMYKQVVAIRKKSGNDLF